MDCTSQPNELFKRGFDEVNLPHIDFSKIVRLPTTIEYPFFTYLAMLKESICQEILLTMEQIAGPITAQKNTWKSLTPPSTCLPPQCVCSWPDIIKCKEPHCCKYYKCNTVHSCLSVEDHCLSNAQ